ncbi:histidine kinase/DNA gyrase B/HSP90-like ATPase [Saccharothrix saharensis]|uniref:histidine kinase n=1 Tax=Saccharothrix saharensis TaxID=571190 RepID=A0A543JQ02_9PSEU|nr:ATP-binding protein [Saccharothrix saharensis]TQM84937.1 histidine kinase/DNA gyrase B/HSP90-like ATPase [Saccharothrix saharensis]
MDRQTLAVAFWFLLAIVLITLFLLVRQQRTTRALRVRADRAEERARALAEEERHLVEARLPALAESLGHRPVEVPGPKRPDAAEGHEQVLALFADSVRQATERGEQSARATLKSMMRAVQSLSNEQQVAISAMQERHDDPDVLAGLMRVDHMNSQLNRRAQATAVLCGSWPGQQRSASPLTDVVRGATSRIRDYLRINLPAESDVAVVSRAVEPVVLAVAELLDNAARHSPPNTSVEVNFQQAHNGMVVMVDDGGVGMTVEELDRAARLLAGHGASDINRLGDPPQVGFAVIGVLAERYGFRVSVDTRSPYGGVRAVVFLPTELLTRVSKPTMPDNAVALPPEQRRPPTAVVDDAVLGRTPGGLPRRRRTQPADQGAPPSAAPVPTPTDQRIATGLAAWKRGTESGRATTPPVAEGNTQA